jgi:PST family polysaccharide transporter
MHTYGRFAANYCTRNTDNLLVGWRFGPEPLGFYKKAYDLFALPFNQLVVPLTSVAVSTLSRVARNPAQYQRYLLKALSTLALVGMALGTNLTLVGSDLVILLLGSQWHESGRIFTLLSPGIGIMLVYSTHSWIHLSLGRPDRWFRWGFVEFTVTGLSFVAGLPWGPRGVAVAWVSSLGLLTIPALWYASRPANLPLAPLLSGVWKYVLSSLLAGSACTIVFHTILLPEDLSDPIRRISRILLVSLVFLVLYLSMIILLHRGAGPLREFTALVQEMTAPSLIANRRNMARAATQQRTRSL